MTKLIMTASKVIGVQQILPQDIFKKRVVKKAFSIINCPSHPLHNEFVILPSGRRYRVIGGKTSRFKNSFIPTAILMLNSL